MTAAPAYWIGVAVSEHVARGAAAGFCMFAHGKHEAVKKLRPGDCFAYYAPRTTLEGGEPVRAFTAIGRVDPGEPEQQAMTATMTGWRRAATYWRARAADVYPLLDQLSFVHDPKHWGMAFRRSLFRASEADFLTIAEAMGVPRNEVLS